MSTATTKPYTLSHAINSRDTWPHTD